MTSAPDLLLELEAAFTSVMPIDELMRPGASDEEISLLEADLGPYRLPVEARQWWQWHNGFRTWFSGRHVITTAEAVDFRTRSREIAEAWNEAWLPISIGSKGHMIAFDLAVGEEKGPGMVRDVELSDPSTWDRETIPFSELVRLWISLLGQGAYHLENREIRKVRPWRWTTSTPEAWFI